MMKTLDRYILRQFLLNFVIIFSVMTLLLVVVSMMLNFDEFLGAREKPFDNAVLGTLYTIVDFYGPNILFFYVMMGGLALVGAMGFTFASLSRTGELVAMATSGWSFHRVALSVVVAGCLLSFLALPIQEIGIPPLAGKLMRGPSDARKPPKQSIAYEVDGRGNLFTARAFDRQNETLTGLTILGRDADGRASFRVTAESARWNAAAEAWMLTEGRMLRFEPPGTSSAAQPQAAALASFPTDLSPQLLLVRQAAIYARLLGMPELLRMSANPAADQNLIRRVIHSRFAAVVLNVLILLMTLPFFLNREPVNFTVQTVKALGLSLSAWGVGIMVMQAGFAGLNPMATSWFPIAVYLPLTAWFLLRVKT